MKSTERGIAVPREAIVNVVNTFANAFDLKDWHGLKAVLANDIECDYTSLRGVKDVVTREVYVGKRVLALNHLRTHHLMANHQVTVGDETATCIASAMIWRSDDDRSFNTHAVYRFGLRRGPGGWVIHAIRQEVLWNEGDASIHAGARTEAHTES
ncbi:nuclear transport factor 2 family protein [Saccharospirillum salsuginis]|uniref:SnoaL-like domain-containing protein n=1 Tax=Saccharospirillum salsuginis TaxID=418750 RepID=A0A918KLT5_9GAMM|nr:nuclear transport factor 2 family protein [Saccharospirillum salsuginis]GGX68779.1 hypothetical protein GCM10007392_40520 [Saccharospirillum salsuginis]